MELVYQVVCERKCFWASTISDSEGCHRPLSDGQILQAKKKKGKKSNVESDLSKEFRPEIVVYCRLFLFCKQVCSSRDAMHHAMLFNSETMYFGKAINYNGSTHLALASSQYSVDLKKEYYLCSTSMPSSTAWSQANIFDAWAGGDGLD